MSGRGGIGCGIAAIAVLTSIHLLVIRNVFNGTWVWETGHVYLLNVLTTFFIAIILAAAIGRKNILVFWLIVFAVTGGVSAFEARYNDRNRDVIVARLSDANERVRIDAAQKLSEIGYARAVPELAKALHDPSEEVRKYAAKALAKTEKLKAIELLASGLEDASLGVQQATIDALDSVHNAEVAVPALVKYLDRNATSDADTVRRDAAALLCKTDSANDAFKRALIRRDTPVLAGAAKCYVARGFAGSESALIEGLDRAGTREIAEIYLNSGNAVLADGAKRWAEARGYKLEQGPAKSAFKRWGESSH